MTCWIRLEIGDIKVKMEPAIEITAANEEIDPTIGGKRYRL